MSAAARPSSVMPPVAENITRLIPYRPGKPIEEVKRELGLSRVVKLASNENNIGPSPLALAAIQEAAGRVFLYPEGSCHDLRLAVATYLDIPTDHLIFGNGSDDIIRLLGLTFLTQGDDIIQADPSFSQYEAAATLNGAVTHRVPCRDWTHDLEAMAERITPRTRLIFITNPNNPTGTTVGAAEVRAFLRRVPETALVVFDEAYYEYVEREDYPDTLAYVREGANVITLRTYSKAYGMAGLRLGYGVARPEIIAALEQVREPFNVNLIAQAAGIAALGDHKHLARTLTMNSEGKAALYAGFERLGLDYAPTDANFVWVDVQRDSRTVFNALLQQGVIVRTGDVFGAPTHLRITIGRPDENALFLDTLEAVLKVVPPTVG